MKNRSMKNLVLAGVMVLVLSGCGNESTQEVQGTTDTVVETAKTDVPITSSWRLTSYTVNGTTTEVDGEPTADEPAFECSDESNCIVYNLGEGHPGTMVSEDGKYMISFNDSGVGMIGTISGDQLTLVNTKGTVEMVFQAK